MKKIFTFLHIHKQSFSNVKPYYCPISLVSDVEICTEKLPKITVFQNNIDVQYMQIVPFSQTHFLHLWISETRFIQEYFLFEN
jgi:hypothetical protein